MAAYEVATEDLVAIRDQLANQAGTTDAVSTGVTQASSTMLAQLDAGLSRTETTIAGLLDALGTTVATATATAEAADWIGPDALLFRDANTDLLTAIIDTNARLTGALTEHRAATTRVDQTLLEMVQLFGGECSISSALTAELSAAVGAEAESYEQAFNGSWPADAAAGATGAPGAPPTPQPEVPEWEAQSPDKRWHLDENGQWQPGPEHPWKRRWGTGEDPADSDLSVEPLWEDKMDPRLAQLHEPFVEDFGSEDGLNGIGSLAGPTATVEAKANAGLNATHGAFIGGAIGGSALAAEAKGHLGHGPVSADGRAFVGAEGGAEGQIGLGPTGVRGSASVQAFLGAKAAGEVSAEYAGVKAGVGGEISYGIGGHAELDGSFTTERVGFSIDAGATLGVGAGVSFDVSVNPKEVLASLDEYF